ncbi:MAG: general secretion pathway protein GspB [Deltaproteobacteria bacterium]|nr:general secretion pathway protein GspB [Deltaproteobacteria bacterium]
MSFILDALKRAERDRRLEKAPDLSAVYEEDPPRHRKPWVWGLIGGAILLGGVVSVLMLWPLFDTSQEENVSGLNAKQRAPEAVKQDAPQPAHARHETKTVSKDADKNRAQTANPLPVRRVTKAVASNTSQTDRASKGGITPQVKSIGADVKPPTKGPPSSVDGIRSGLQVPDPRIKDADEMPEPAKIREVVEDDDTFENDSSSPPPLEKSAKNTRPASKKPIPLVSELPDDVKEMLSGFHINIHVYAEDPAERLVFINMRNRKVGDRIGEGGHVLKEITPDGVIIDYGKGQALLRVGR